MSDEILAAAVKYRARGWVEHPLSSPADTKFPESAGKRPLLTEWQKRTKPATDAEHEKWFRNTDNNVGLVCGKASNITVIDLDSFLFAPEIFGAGVDTLKASRIEGRGHVYFKYNPNLPASKHHDLGIEVLSNGSNVVVPPSIHRSGEKYRWKDPDCPIIEMSKEVETNLLNLFKTEVELKRMLAKCRTCFRDVIKRKHDALLPGMHGADGREFMLALCTDLKAAGACEEHALMFAKLIYGKDYDDARTLREWRNIDAVRTWTCLKLQEKVPAFLDPAQCERCQIRREGFRETGKNIENENSSDNYKKATCKSCKNFPANGYCTTKRTGVTPEKGACNRYIPEGTPDHVEEEKEPEAPQHIRDKANEVLEKGDPVQYVFDAHQRLHIGDGILTSTRIAAVGNQSASNTKGIQPSADGNSGKGKSDGDKKFVHLLPKEYVLSGSVSDKVLYYKKDLKASTYIFSDDVVLSEDLTSTIKRATSNFQGYTPHHTLDKDRNVLENHIPPRIIWGLNSIDNVNSLQLINRQFGGSVDESVEQDENVLLYQKVCGMLGTDELPETDDVLICREIIRDIKKHLFKVIIPFNYLIEWRDSNNRRNFDMFEDMIRGFAVFRYRQRERHGDILVAELQDFEDAENLYGHRTEQQGRKLTDPELRLVKILNEISIADSKELQDMTGLSQGRISHLMKGRGRDSDSGLLHKVKELHCEKRTEATKNGTITKTYYTISGFDENKYKDKVVWIEDEARKEYEAYYQLITRLLLLRINSGEEVITSITNITLLHSNEKYNKLLQLILNPQKDLLLGYFAKKGNKGNNLTTDSDNEEVISGNKLVISSGILPSKICGICEQSLNGSREPGPSGVGTCHPSCVKLHRDAITQLREVYDKPVFDHPSREDLPRLLQAMEGTLVNTPLEMDEHPVRVAVQAYCRMRGWQATS